MVRRRLDEVVEKYGRYYLVTIRKNTKEFVSRHELNLMYIEVQNKLSKYDTEWSNFISYELTKSNVMHVHTYCSCLKSPWIKSPINWNINLLMFPSVDLKKVINYLNKDGQHPCAQQQREYESYYYNQGNPYL